MKADEDHVETLSTQRTQTLKALPAQDHYEVLELSRRATSEEIERAYGLIQSAYAPEGLAHYSIYDDQDVSAIRDRVEEAYRILSDPVGRQAYDEKLLESGDEPLTATAQPQSADSMENQDPDHRSLTSEESAVSDSHLEEEMGDFDGAKLRRARLRRGFELEQIAEVTKIGAAHLRRLEDEEFSDLPADVYVRGFVTAYATTIGLDPEKVVGGYMARVEAARTQPRARFRYRS